MAIPSLTILASWLGLVATTSRIRSWLLVATQTAEGEIGIIMTDIGSFQPWVEISGLSQVSRVWLAAAVLTVFQTILIR